MYVCAGYQPPNFNVWHVCDHTNTYIIIYGVIVDLPQLIYVEVQLYLTQHTLHHGHQNILIPVTITTHQNNNHYTSNHDNTQGH